MTASASQNRCARHEAEQRATQQAYTSERRRTVYGSEYQRLRKQVLAEEFACALCGVEGIKLYVDHIVPLAQGGPNVRENLRALCQPCNNTRPRGPRGTDRQRN